MITLAVILPCYNEEACIPLSAKKLEAKMVALSSQGLISKESRLIFVDDGSHDASWKEISELHNSCPELYSGLKLSRNEGHQYALLAGLEYAYTRFDAAITIDVDLQDDINAIDEMLVKFNAGNDIVYGVRSSRKSDSPFKRQSAQSYYALMKGLGVELVPEAADFRLMSKRAIGALLRYQENNLFLRGLVPQLGFKSDTVSYERLPREAGKSKYPFKKMLALGWNGISSFSSVPLNLLWSLGSLLAFLAIAELITFACLYGYAVLPYRDLPFILGSIGLATGIVLQGLGVLGSYIGKIAIEVKKRPRYFVEETLDKKE
jgi:glycosyltransferase involved in cell wall biosynthesis